MAAKSTRRGLGRGLSALIPESDMDHLASLARGDVTPAPLAPTEEASTASPQPIGSSHPAAHAGVSYIPVDAIEANPYQPRQIFTEPELEELAESITTHGVLQPILVRPLPAGSTSESSIKYQLIAGERRWRASQRANLKLVPALIHEADDRTTLELALIENVQRKDISPIESAHAYRRLADEFGLSQEEIGKRVGKNRVTVANTLRLLDLPQEAIKAILDGQITEGHGRALLTATGDSARRALLRRIIRDGLSVREVERLAREEPKPERIAPVPNADLERLEKSLQRALGSKLKLKPKRRGGQIVIDFNSPEDLQRLVKRLTGNGQ